MITLLELDALDQRPLVAPPGPALVLVRAGNRVIGEVRLVHFEPEYEGAIRRHVVDQLRIPLLWSARVEHDGPGHVGSCSFSVVVSRRGRPGLRPACLESLDRLDPPPAEMLVCEGDAWTDPFEARGDVVVLVDDDARPTANLLGVLARAFDADAVDAVTTLVRPEVLATGAQWLYERWFPGITSSFDAGIVTAASWHPPAAFVGTRTSLAVRRDRWEWFVAQEPAPTVPLDALLVDEIRKDGGAVLHEPSAVVRHVRPRDRQELLDAVRSHRASTAWDDSDVRGTLSRLRSSAAGLRRIARSLRQAKVLQAELELVDLSIDLGIDGRRARARG